MILEQFRPFQEVCTSRDLYIGDAMVAPFGTSGIVICALGDQRVKVKFDEIERSILNVTAEEIRPQLNPRSGFHIGQNVVASLDLLVGLEVAVRHGERGQAVGASEDDRIDVKFSCHPGILSVQPFEISPDLPLAGGFRIAQRVEASRDLRTNETLLVAAGTHGIVMSAYSDSRVTVQFDRREDGQNCGVNVVPEEIRYPSEDV
mmetsp:Transcript_37157/g.68513  ORF Transcript_37157/g.68513 Transcript_37157/m.68513 type:complete len:204 (+) Transcript_37157:1-612(+)